MSKFAVIATGGKQYKVSEGDTLLVEKLDAAEGAKVSFDVLMLTDGDKTTVGTPIVDGAKVEAVAVKAVKGEKINIFKYKPKKNVRKRQGHRQPYTQIRIEKIKTAKAKA